MKLFAKALIALLLLCGTAQGSILPWMINSSGQVRLVFEALTYDPVTYELKGVLTGTGDMTVARTTTQYVLDHESVYRTAAANSPAWYKARKVENLLTYSEDLTDASWVPLGDVAVIDSNTVTWTAAGNTTGVNKTMAIAGGTAGKTLTFSCVVYTDSGTEPFKLKNTHGGVTDNYSATLTATTTPQRFTYTVTNNSTAGTGAQIVAVVSANAGTTMTLNIEDNQLEDATGRTGTTTPSEYIPTTTAAVTKWYANTNGNTVASNVVTEATGTLLSPLPMLQVDPALTNSLTYSRDLTNAAWTATNMTTAYTSTGLQGAANTATRLTATAGNATVIRAAAHTAASATHATKCFIRRITGTGTIELTLDNGTTWQDITASVDSAYGEGVPVEQAALTDPQVGIRIVTSGDAVDVGDAELFAAKALADVKKAGPIFTTTAAATTGSQSGSFDSSNISNTSGLITFSFLTQGAQNLISTFAEQVGVTLQLDDGTTQDTVAAAVNTTHKAGIWWHAATNEMGLCINGTCEAAVAYDGTILDGALDLFRSGGFSAMIGPIKIYNKGKAASYQTHAVTDTTP